MKSGEVTIAAEGFLLELERRGYNSNGAFIPQAVLDNPDQVEQLTREYVHAGSDISQAFTVGTSTDYLPLKAQPQLLSSLRKFNRYSYHVPMHGPMHVPYS